MADPSTNADELVDFFNNLSNEIKRDIVKRGVSRGVTAVYNRAMANTNGPRTAPARSYPVPVRTAELRNGIRPYMPGTARSIPGRPEGAPLETSGAVVSTAPHSLLIHDGHPEPIVIVPVRAKALKFKVIGSVQTHYKRGVKAGQKLDSPKINFGTLYRKKVVLPPAGPRPFLENARNDSAEEANNGTADEVIVRINEANAGNKGG